MKKIHLAFCVLLFISIASTAQVSVNVNFGPPPVWAPAERVETQYYYLPDIDSYYDVPSARFIYVKNGKWFRSASLPYRYKNYNLRGGKVVYLTDYRGDSPYLYHKSHKIKYFKEVKYKEPKYEKREENREERREENENGNGREHGKGKGHKK